MSLAQVNLTLGTAGHIDHGKTALVRCLTGCETDRLKAEKERGMSIDLGFAPCRIGDTQIGIVDVPGHENFIKTMVAGAAGMDGVILVVAADDGVMPQTREHLEILSLLGVEHGLVALTKIDRVDPDHVELAREELDDLVRGTFLEGAPVCPMSSVTGEGFDPFYTTLTDLVGTIQPRRLDGLFRLPLDRAFSVKGHGTVLAGIPMVGSAQVGDEVTLLPQGILGRIRGIEVYGRSSDTVQAGQCAAVNVRHWDQQTIRRGDTLTVPGFFEPSLWYVGTLRLLHREKPVVLKSGAQVKFHAGTSEVTATVYPLAGDRLQEGEEHLVQVRAASPLVAGPGDRFLIRTPSPPQTIGGGTIVEATGKRLKRKRANLLADLRQRAAAVGDETRFVEYCLREAESLVAGPTALAGRAKIPTDRVDAILTQLADQGKAIRGGSGTFLHADTAAAARRQVLELVDAFHRRSPESPGLTLDALRQSYPIDRSALDAILDLLKAEGRLVDRKGRLAAPTHEATFGKDAQLLEQVEALYREHPFRPPGVEELVDKTGSTEALVRTTQSILREHERLVRVAENVFFHAEAVERARAILVEFLEKEGRLESVRFKYLLDTTRKFALPLLDHFDQIGVTRRSGNTRFLKGPPK